MMRFSACLSITVSRCVPLLEGDPSHAGPSPNAQETFAPPEARFGGNQRKTYFDDDRR